ncbi:M23 family metallopeptidase [Pacificispira sp.]|uniref:M23 family metallopeptidase n=1 Tax=Pacificispira sp. TaxID=2888761 RepID=UPI003B523D6E
MRKLLIAIASMGAVMGAALPAVAQDALMLSGILTQGGHAEGTVPPGSTVEYDGKQVTVGDDGVFIIGFHRDEPNDTVLNVTLPDGTKKAYPLQVDAREYDIQRIDGLPQDKVEPPPEVMERIAADAAAARAARNRNSPETWYKTGWIWPVQGKITGVYGSQRILNGAPKQPHYGFDIAAKEGTEIVAPADGMVSLVHPDMYFSGATLMIDHGRGLASTFLHLKSIAVEEGQFVKKGDVIGTVGSTGRSTGPHLDWRVNWFEKRLDASLFAGPMPGPSYTPD